MDLSNYQLIQAEARRIKSLSPEDREDLAQDVCLKLLESNKAKKITRKYIRKLIMYILMNKRRKESRRPEVIYNSKLADRLAGED